MRYHIIGPMSNIEHYNIGGFTKAIANIMLAENIGEITSVTTPFTELTGLGRIRS